MGRTLKVQEAKNRFSEVVEEALARGPQVTVIDGIRSTNVSFRRKASEKHKP